MTDQQFVNAFNAAGAWFLLTQYEEIANWTGSRADLVDYMFKKEFDNVRASTATRVGCVLRIIKNGRGHEALLKVRDSRKINIRHPEARSLADEKIAKLFGYKQNRYMPVKDIWDWMKSYETEERQP